MPNIVKFLLRKHKTGVGDVHVFPSKLKMMVNVAYYSLLSLPPIKIIPWLKVCEDQNRVGVGIRSQKGLSDTRYVWPHGPQALRPRAFTSLGGCTAMQCLILHSEFSECRVPFG